MWKSDLSKERDRRAAIGAALAMADRERGPFADAIGGQNGRATRRRGQERLGSM
jgi:hypothetical protein